MRQKMLGVGLELTTKGEGQDYPFIGNILLPNEYEEKTTSTNWASVLFSP